MWADMKEILQRKREDVMDETENGIELWMEGVMVNGSLAHLFGE